MVEMKKFILLVLAVLTLTSCSKPLPADKLSYVGEWESKEMYLLIHQDGTVVYKRVQDGGSTSINAPLKEFIGDDFVVGVAFLTSNFDVTEAPHLVGDEWVMVVDGVRLTKNQGY
ncbi:type III secretory pathway lipoprotein EscJ [Pseudoalteromonas sp. MBR-15]|jgi:type III secretory pathway lipoprotein EscJ